MAMATSVNLVVQDGKGSKSVVSFYVPSTTALADVAETAQEFADRLDNIIGGAIVSISASFSIDVPVSAKTTPNPTSDVEEGALYLWNTDLGFSTRFRVPTHLETLILAGTRAVDLSAADVAALRSFMINGFTTSTPTLVTPSDYREDDIVALDTAYESFRASRGRP